MVFFASKGFQSFHGLLSTTCPCGYLWEASNGKFSVVGEMQEMDPRLGRDFVCGRCKKEVDGLVELAEELCEEVETVSVIWGIG